MAMLRIAPSSRHHPLHATRRKVAIPLGSQRFLAAFEGIEGGFAIGASLLIGLNAVGMDRTVLLSTALISLIVSGFNSASVKYSSEHYLDELDGREKKSKLRHYFIPAFIEFVCYLAISALTILPLIVIDNLSVAVGASVVITFALLFLAGFWRGYVLRSNGLRDATETLLLGIGIVAIGLASGLLAHSL